MRVTPKCLGLATALIKYRRSALSAGYTRTAIAHKRALAAPMLGCKMVANRRRHLE